MPTSGTQNCWASSDVVTLHVAHLGPGRRYAISASCGSHPGIFRSTVNPDPSVLHDIGRGGPFGFGNTRAGNETGQANGNAAEPDRMLRRSGRRTADLLSARTQGPGRSGTAWLSAGCVSNFRPIVPGLRNHGLGGKDACGDQLWWRRQPATNKAVASRPQVQVAHGAVPPPCPKQPGPSAPSSACRPATAIRACLRVTGRPDRLDNPNRPVSILSNSKPARCALAPAPNHPTACVPVRSYGLAHRCGRARVRPATRSPPDAPPCSRYCSEATTDVADRRPLRIPPLPRPARRISYPPVRRICSAVVLAPVSAMLSASGCGLGE